MGATTTKEQGEWVLVGGTGDFAMARGVIKRKVHQKVADGEVLELSVDAFCHMKVRVRFNFILNTFLVLRILSLVI